MTKGFDVYQDKSGKWWIWSEYLDCNVAIKERTEESAMKAAVESLIFHCEMYKDERDRLRLKMSKVESCFKELFEESE